MGRYLIPVTASSNSYGFRYGRCDGRLKNCELISDCERYFLKYGIVLKAAALHIGGQERVALVRSSSAYWVTCSWQAHLQTTCLHFIFTRATCILLIVPQAKHTIYSVQFLWCRYWILLFEVTSTMGRIISLDTSTNIASLRK